MKNKLEITHTHNELNELKGKIRAEGYSYRTLSPLVQMAPATLCLKTNGKADFTATEICRLCETLNIEASEISKIFFPQMFR